MEQLIHESPVALQAQVEALAAGTNPIVYFPVGTEKIPPLPKGMLSIIVSGNREGAGTYYYSPERITGEAILKAVREGKWWKILGFMQSKEEVAKGFPVAVVARDARGNEIKTAAVDARDISYVYAQGLILRVQFPQASIAVEDLRGVLLERMMWGLKN
jgi:hypothetical protein